jgi:signal transduction histidine kinase
MVTPPRTRRPTEAALYSGPMSPLGTMIVAWSAVYGYVCLYFILFWMSRRTDREYLAFGLLSGSLSVYAIARALRIDAVDWEQSVFAAQLGGVGLLAMVPFLADFSLELGGGRSRVRALAYAWSALGLVALASGAFTRLASPSGITLRELPWGATFTEASIRPGGLFYLAVGLLLAGHAAMGLLRPARSDQHVRVIVAATGLNLAAAAHDLLVESFTNSGLYLLEHSALASVFAMSYVLLDRFARTGTTLRERTAELSSSYDELRTTQEQLVRKEQLAAVGELSAVIAHEVRNPLAIIKNAVSGLRRANLRASDQATLLDILDEETDKLNRLMHDLLAYARPVVPKGRTLGVSDLVRRSVERAKSGHVHADAVEVVLDLDGASAEIHGDPELLRHAVVNVVDNALQAMHGGGTLTIRARDTAVKGHDAVALSFADTGEGMDTIVREKARDPFFTTRPSGTGLGLAIVERVVSNHGGSVEITSRHGEGTTVTLTLPREHVSILPIPPPESPNGRLSGIREGR